MGYKKMAFLGNRNWCLLQKSRRVWSSRKAGHNENPELAVKRLLGRSRALGSLFMIFLSILATGCGTLENGHGWGQDAIYPITLERIPRAACHAFFDLQTLVPAAGALVFAIDDFDEKVSDWATEHTPIFGSEKAARDASDYLQDALLGETLLTTLATLSGEDSKDWTYGKMKGIAVELAAQGMSRGATVFLKDTTGRKRPDRSGDDSFPSGHASGAFSYSTLANRNLNFIPAVGKGHLPIQVGNLLLATSVAWARVEGRQHFPSDVLAGAALGHFLSAFIYDAFLGLPADKSFAFDILPSREGAMVGLSFGF